MNSIAAALYVLGAYSHYMQAVDFNSQRPENKKSNLGIIVVTVFWPLFILIVLWYHVWKMYTREE